MELRRIYSSEDNLSNFDILMIAIWASYFGDPDLAMDIIEKFYRINPMGVNPWFPIGQEYRKTPRFKEFVKEIGLVDYWKEYGWPDTNICHPVGDDNTLSCPWG